MATFVALLPLTWSLATPTGAEVQLVQNRRHRLVSLCHLVISLLWIHLIVCRHVCAVYLMCCLRVCSSCVAPRLVLVLTSWRMNYHSLYQSLLIPEYEWGCVLCHISSFLPSTSSISSCSSTSLLNVPSGEYQAVVSPRLLEDGW